MGYVLQGFLVGVGGARVFVVNIVDEFFSESLDQESYSSCNGLEEE